MYKYKKGYFSKTYGIGYYGVRFFVRIKNKPGFYNFIVPDDKYNENYPYINLQNDDGQVYSIFVNKIILTSIA